MWRSYGWRSTAEGSAMPLGDHTLISTFAFIPVCSRRGRLGTHCGGGKAQIFLGLYVLESSTNSV